MLFQYVKPNQILRPYIRDYLIAHFNQLEFIPPKAYPALPENDITFYIRGSIFAETPELNYKEIVPRSIIMGQSTYRKFFNLSHNKEFMMVNISFFPGALFKIFGIPMQEFTQKNMDAEGVFGKIMAETNDKLTYAKSYVEIIDIINQFFIFILGRMKNKTNLHMDKVSRIIMNQPESFSLEKMAGLCCLSNSQFERKFSQQIGVSPKFFSRICRFRKASMLKEKFPDLDWLSIAIESGYYDYQHLAKDFKRFSGETPVSMLSKFETSPEKWLKLI